jgi:hypothetical protein
VSETGGPIVRDFLYVDLSRTRSLLGQIARGAPETVTEQLQGAWEFSANLNLGVIQTGGNKTSGGGSTETRSLSDVHFALFEEAAEALGLLTDVTEITSDSSDWFGGRVHSELEEGQLIRVTGPVRLVDSKFVGESLDRMEKLLDGWADVMLASAESQSPSTQPAPTKRTGGGQRADRDRERAKLKKASFGGAAPEMITALRTVMSSLLEDGISVRAMPCGEHHPQCSFSGTLLNRSEYVEPERGAIFARLGMRPTNWTMVGIVSRFAPAEVTEFGTPEGEFNRTTIETMTIGLMDRIESLGLSAAPAFPGIAVTPIALYRVLPWAAAE